MLGDFITGRAELIVWLELPLPLKLAGLVRRSFRRVTRRAPMAQWRPGNCSHR